MLKRHENNLRKLALYLLALPKDYKHFDMDSYCVVLHDSDLDEYLDIEDVKKSTYHKCGAVACALGHGPAAGINSRGCEDWGDYSEKKFGMYPNCNDWEWCFSGYWSNIDNTPQGAGKRILWMLENGIPDAYYSQMRGGVKLCYADWEPSL